MLELDNGHKFNEKTATLYSSSNGGLFSNFFHTIWSIIDLKNMGYIVEGIDFSRGFKYFRGKNSGNLYPIFFKINEPEVERWRNYKFFRKKIPRIDHHGVYSLYPYDLLSLILSAYFENSDRVRKNEQYFCKKYSLVSNNYLGLYLRGTDKVSEVKSPNLELVLKNTNYFRKVTKLDNIIIQTDDESIQRFLIERIENVTIIEELPVVSGIKGFHYENYEKGLVDPIDFSAKLIAMTNVLARSKVLMVSSSNLSGWLCLLRGNAIDIVQYNKKGNVVTPLYLRLFRLKNTLRRYRSILKKDNFYYV